MMLQPLIASSMVNAIAVAAECAKQIHGAGHRT
jgi:hypothetical protein